MVILTWEFLIEGRARQRQIPLLKYPMHEKRQLLLSVQEWLGWRLLGNWISLGIKLWKFSISNSLILLIYNVIVLEARDRVGGRVCTDNNFQGSVDLGGSIITGLEGNPITVLVKQLGLKLHVLSSACPIYHSDGTPIDQELDDNAEKLFNSILDASVKLQMDMGKVCINTF